MAKFIHNYVVHRKTWARGDASVCAFNFLLRPDGRRCCLGFVAQQCGYADNETRGRDLPSSVWRAAWFGDGTKRDFPLRAFEAEAAVINDSASITDKVREQLLTALFAEHGYGLKFVD